MPEPLVRFGVLAVSLDPGEDQTGFALEALERFHQVMGRHGQLDLLPAVLLGPAEVLQQAEVFAELQAEALGRDEVLVSLQRVPEVTD